MSSNTRAATKTNGLIEGFLVSLIISLVLSLTLLISVPPALAYGADGPTITVESAGEVTPGSEFSVSVTIAGNSGFAASSLEVSYDSNALELLGFDTTGVMQGTTIENVESATIGNLSLSNITSDGQLFGLRFRVLDNAAGGNYDISVALKGGTEKNFVDAQANPVPVTFSAGSVQVPGDGPGAENPGSNNPGGTTPGNNNPGATAPGTGTSTPVQVEATNANGDSIPLELRGEAGNLEYSLDGGLTWNEVPSNGIIETEDGTRISVFGDGEADYYVQDLPESMVPLAGGDEGIAPWIWIVIAAVAVVIVVAVVVVMSRRKNAAASIDFGSENEGMNNAGTGNNGDGQYVGKHGRK